MGGVTREQKILKGHPPRVIHHPVHPYTKITCLVAKKFRNVFKKKKKEKTLVEADGERRDDFVCLCLLLLLDYSQA